MSTMSFEVCAPKSYELKKCTQCHLWQPFDEFRVRIRKNASGPKEEHLAACKGCEAEYNRQRFAREGDEYGAPTRLDSQPRR